MFNKNLLNRINTFDLYNYIDRNTEKDPSNK